MTVALGLALQGDVSTHDIVFGAGTLLVLLPIFYLIGKTVARFQNYRFSKQWAPLLPLLEGGRIIEDGGVATTSRLEGRCQGVPVFATMTPNVKRYQYSMGNGNRFSVGVRDVPGASDWSARWNDGIPFTDSSGWSVTAADAALAERLKEAGVIALIEPFGKASLRYETRVRTLEWRANIEPWVALPPDRFGQVLAAMLEAALMSRALNH